MKLSRSTLKRIINAPLNAMGLNLELTASGGSMPSWFSRMKLARKLGFSPRGIIDGGAFKGQWSREVALLFPGTPIVVVEPNPLVQKDLHKNISNIQPPPEILKVALGASPGKANFNIWSAEGSDSGASLLDHVSGKAEMTVAVEVDTLDNILRQTSILPDLVKLDLQGAELSALMGATRVLEQAEFMMIEFGCLEAYKGRSSPSDLLNIMYANDFCLYDIVDCHYRPYDGALTGGDFFFVKNSSILKNYDGWE